MRIRNIGYRIKDRPFSENIPLTAVFPIVLESCYAAFEIAHILTDTSYGAQFAERAKFYSLTGSASAILGYAIDKAIEKRSKRSG